MKKIQVILITFLVALNLSAQSTEYDTCQLLKQFEGVWQYSNGIDTINLYLRLHRDPYLHYVNDRLWGWHEYKQGNNVIESNYQLRFMSLPASSVDSFSCRLSLQYCLINSDTLRGSITDYNQAKELHQVTAIVNPARTQMIWTQKHSEWYGAFTGATGMTLPKRFVLTKQ